MGVLCARISRYPAEVRPPASSARPGPPMTSWSAARETASPPPPRPSPCACRCAPAATQRVATAATPTHCFFCFCFLGGGGHAKSWAGRGPTPQALPLAQRQRHDEGAMCKLGRAAIWGLLSRRSILPTRTGNSPPSISGGKTLNKSIGATFALVARLEDLPSQTNKCFQTRVQTCVR